MKKNALRKKLDNILEYMLEMLTSANRTPRDDARNVRKELPLITKVAKLFATFSWSLDIIKDSADVMQLWTDIDNARGVVLDRHGTNFGVLRGGASDEFYRLMIRIKLLAQLSGGDIETIIAALAGLYEIDPVEIGLYELFPAKLNILISEEALPVKDMGMRELVGTLTKKLIAHGVGLDVIYKEEEFVDTEYFIGGKVVSEYIRISLRPHIELPPALISSPMKVGGKVASEFSRTQLITILEEG